MSQYRGRRAFLKGGTLLLAASGLLSASTMAEEPRAEVSQAEQDADGIRVHTVNSPYQASQTEIRVLLPDQIETGRRYPAVYVLPVTAGSDARYGNGFMEIKQHSLHNKYQAIFVAPTFCHLPWYADHPSDPGMRQESHFLKVVVPFVEETYPALRRPEGRLLLGFSKSGWGAYSLLLRHPDVFGKAAAWDAPLMKDKPDQFGMGGVFGSQDNFAQYQISKLLGQHVADLRGKKRLVLTGYGNFRQHHQQIHDLLTELGIPHDYRDGPARKHDWHSGWVDEAVELLLK